MADEFVPQYEKTSTHLHKAVQEMDMYRFQLIDKGDSAQRLKDGTIKGSGTFRFAYKYNRLMSQVKLQRSLKPVVSSNIRLYRLFTLGIGVGYLVVCTGDAYYNRQNSCLSVLHASEYERTDFEGVEALFADSHLTIFGWHDRATLVMATDTSQLLAKIREKK